MWPLFCNCILPLVNLRNICLEPFLADQQYSDIQKRLSQQEREFDINMYDSLTPADEPELLILQNMGHSREDAACLIFENRFKARNLPNSSAAASSSTSAMSTNVPLQHQPNFSRMIATNNNSNNSSNNVSAGNYSTDVAPVYPGKSELNSIPIQQQQHQVGYLVRPIHRSSPQSSPSFRPPQPPQQQLQIQQQQQSPLLPIPPINTPVGISRSMPTVTKSTSLIDLIFVDIYRFFYF